MEFQKHCMLITVNVYTYYNVKHCKQKNKQKKIQRGGVWGCVFSGLDLPLQ